MTRRTNRTAPADPAIADVAALVGDRARAAMLLALLDGRSLPARELAFRGKVSPQAASAHLAKLVAGGLLAATPSGRERLFRLAGPEVGHALEALAALAPPVRIVALNQHLAFARLREARSCYDHLAGRLGVAVTDAFVARGALRKSGGTFVTTARAEAIFAEFDVDIALARAQRRSFARACLDWTERRPHLAGSLGAQIRERFLATGWVELAKNDRSLVVTAFGRRELERRLAIVLPP